jgi:putative beta-lysine N-acetyltransferase
MPDVLANLEALAREKGYGKIVAKARESDFCEFMARGYRVEARVPEFFGSREPGIFVGKFLDSDREAEAEPARVAEVLDVARKEGAKHALTGVPEPDLEALGPDLEIREATANDANAVAFCYGSVFESYPFPIHDPGFIREMMAEGTRYFAVWESKTLVAASSMEPGGAPGAVEMTDFATLPSHRGRGLATGLLGTMGRQARTKGVRVAYTIARALSFGMNITFARHLYHFGGTLVNNTQIAGSIQSMNVWYRTIPNA